MNPISKFVNLFKTQPAESPPMGEVGFDDSILYGGRDFPKYSPDDLIIKKGNGVYRKMMLDEQIKAVLRFKQDAILSRPYYFDTEDTPDEEVEYMEEIADFFNFMIKQIKGSFTDNLTGILSALYNGFSITEKIYQPIEYEGRTMWGLKDMKVRPFDTFLNGFMVDEHGNLFGLEQNVTAAIVPIPIEKVIHFVHQPDIDLHYGESDLRACYRSYWSKDIVIKFQNIHLERHASGFIWAQVEGGLTDPQKVKLQALLSNMSAKSSVHVPSNVKLNSFQPLRTDAYDRAIAQHDKSIAKAMLVPNLLGMSEQGSTGSYAQSEVHFKVFLWVLDHITNRLTETLNEQVFRELAYWNFGTKTFPWFSFEPLSDDQKTNLAKSWGELISKNAVTKSDSDEVHVRRLMGFPDKSEDAEEEPETGDDVEDMIEIPDQEDWISAKGNLSQYIRQELQNKQWLRRVNFAKIEGTLDNHDTVISDGLADSMALARQSIEKQIISIVGNRSLGNVKPKEVENIRIPKGQLVTMRKLLRVNLKSVLDNGYATAQKELPSKKLVNISPNMDKTQAERFLSSKAMKITGVLDQDVLNAVQRILENGIKYDSTLDEVIRSMAYDTQLKSMLPEYDAAGKATNIPARLENIARTNTSDAINQGRMALFSREEFKGFIVSYEYSAILDSRVTDVCESLHGKIRKQWAERTPPNHYQCRSLLVAVTAIDDWSGKENRIPVKGMPHAGFGKELLEQ